MANATEKKEPRKLSDRLVEFIQKNRVPLLLAIGTLIVAFFAFGVVVAIRDATNEKAIASIEELSQQYDSIRVETDETKKSAAGTALLVNLETFAKSHSGFAAARAHSVIAGIRADRKEWSEAVSAWLAAADALPNSYLAPVSVYNAATAAEELGDGTRALELYARCADKYASSFSQAPRAYLAIGRLNEERKDLDAATVAYKKIVETWPNDSWSKLAHGRLLAIASLNTK